MSYTIYPDELFVTNLVMDYYLLRLVKKLCGGRAGVLASLGGAAFGALSYCMLILFPVSFPVNTLLAYVAINTIMVRFGCGLRTPGRLCGGIAGLYIAGFLMGGMLEVLKRFLGFAGTKDVLLAGTVCYLVYAAVLPRYREWRKKSRIRCRVRLQMEGQITEVNVIYRDLEHEVECKLLVKAINKLNAREKMIICLRFGLNQPDGKEKTQKEVADLLGISQSYISRLEKRIMVRLKKEIVRYE